MFKVIPSIGKKHKGTTSRMFSWCLPPQWLCNHYPLGEWGHPNITYRHSLDHSPSLTGFASSFWIFLTPPLISIVWKSHGHVLQKLFPDGSQNSPHRANKGSPSGSPFYILRLISQYFPWLDYVRLGLRPTEPNLGWLCHSFHWTEVGAIGGHLQGRDLEISIGWIWAFFAKNLQPSWHSCKGRFKNSHFSILAVLDGP